MEEEVAVRSERDAIAGESAMRTVDTFLAGEQARRRSALRTWMGMLGLLAGVGVLHGLTLAGWLPPEGRDILASTGAVGAVGLGVLSKP
ncbi:MAG TPA: hypothetical protein VHV30_17835 [Polyangiaceae bacterium]|jgi:hypothetical protein|nr:hypothetical protein [Polyangiaceae bacterium]